MKKLITGLPYGLGLYAVSVDRILDLRHRVLREGLPAEKAHFDGDDELNTWHFALCLNEQPVEDYSIVACVSYMLRPYNKKSAWQLRGMAVEPKAQGHGRGALLLESSLPVVEKDYPLPFWCNARVSAIPFYEKHGWSTVGEAFQIEDAGPHKVMVEDREFVKCL